MFIIDCSYLLHGAWWTEPCCSQGLWLNLLSGFLPLWIEEFWKGILWKCKPKRAARAGCQFMMVLCRSLEVAHWSAGLWTRLQTSELRFPTDWKTVIKYDPNMLKTSVHVYIYPRDTHPNTSIISEPLRLIIEKENILCMELLKSSQYLGK